MRESGNYPMGAEFDPNAPWNQEDTKPVDADVCVSYTLSKNCTIPVCDYIAEEWHEYEADDEGNTISTGGVDYDFSNSNLNEAFLDNEFTIPELLELLANICDNHIESLSLKEQDSEVKTRMKRWKNIKKSCNGWVVDEFEVTQNE